MKARILWIEGKRADGPSFIPGLRKKGYRIEMVGTGTEALNRLAEVSPDLVVLNAASMRSSGKRICRSIRLESNGLPIVVISDPDRSLEGEDCASVVLNLPFTIRKLVNRIVPLLPGEGEVVKAGDIRLDIERNQVSCEDREASLTPRLTDLLRTLIDHAGEVMEREKLFMEVWKTEYTGDTRTLDVHISWLRRAIEENPRKPQHLITIRGVGYRLDV